MELGKSLCTCSKIGLLLDDQDSTLKGEINLFKKKFIANQQKNNVTAHTYRLFLDEIEKKKIKDNF